MKRYTIEEIKSWAGSDFTREELFDLLTDRHQDSIYRS